MSSEAGGPDVKMAALDVLLFLAAKYTTAELVEILDILEGKFGAGELLKDTSIFVAELVKAVIAVLTPDAVRAALAVQFAAADAAGDAAGAAKFGKE